MNSNAFNQMMKSIESATAFTKTLESSNAISKMIQPQLNIAGALEASTALGKSIKFSNSLAETIQSTSVIADMFGPATALAKALESSNAILKMTQILPEIAIQHKAHIGLAGVFDSYNSLYQDIDKTLYSKSGSAPKNQSFTIDEINETVSGIIEKINNEEDTNGTFWNRFIVEIEKLSGPLKSLLYQLLIALIVQLLLNYLSSAFTDISKNTPTNKQEIIRKIRKETRKHHRHSILSDFRFVTANKLNVRQGPSQRTKIIDKLTLGQVVCVQQKNKNWTKIEYTKQSLKGSYRGWVFTRYIKTFKN